MSFAVYDADGYVGDLATNRGLEHFSEEVGKKEKQFPRTMGLLNFGWSPHPDMVREELKEFKPKDSEVKKTVANFILLLGKCDEICVINNGLDDAL